MNDDMWPEQPVKPLDDTKDDELRQKLKDIVTRNGKTGRIPELLEAELDKLEALILSKQNEARINELTMLDNSGHLDDEDYFHGYYLNRIKELKDNSNMENK